jgi:predicted alpha/beta-hydrolase family hydrolase
MQRWKARLATVGETRAFDYPYRLAGRRAPDPLPKLIAAHREALEHTREADPEASIVLIGKSMGGRIGCHVAHSERVAGLVCLGYPLKSPSARGNVRDEVLVGLTTPILFVQGTRDALCPLDLLAEVRGRMTTRNELFVVEGGDHSLEVDKRTLKATGTTQEDADERVLRTIREFSASLSR